jgi:hypothetical protein
MGRPSSFKPEFAEQALKLCKLGATDRELADFFEVSESTVNLWKIVHPEFSESLKRGKSEADERVEQSLYRRALGYSHDAVHFSAYEGEVTETHYVEHYAPDTTACIFWLKNRKPGEWRDKVVLDATIYKGLESLTDEQLARIASEGSTGTLGPSAGEEKLPEVH